jgi:hypothetical protein
MTKRDVLNALATVNFTEDIVVGDVVVTPADIADFVDTSLAQLDNRAAKAAERAANKKAEGDQMRATIKAVIGETPMTIAEIIEAVDDPELTNAKAVARLTQLVKLGEIYKADTKVDGRTLKVYSTVPFTTED